jgi:DNA-binding GntR family transcriptional regulator
MERADDRDVDTLRAIVDEMRRAAEKGEEKELARLDLRFHSSLIHMARHDLLEKTWGPLKIGVRRSLRTRHKIYESLDEVVGNHPALVDAIARREVEEATRLLQEHIDEAGERIVEEWLAGNGEPGAA